MIRQNAHVLDTFCVGFFLYCLGRSPPLVIPRGELTYSLTFEDLRHRKYLMRNSLPILKEEAAPSDVSCY